MKKRWWWLLVMLVGNIISTVSVGAKSQANLDVKKDGDRIIISLADLKFEIKPTHIGGIYSRDKKLVDKIYFTISGTEKKWTRIADQSRPVSFDKPVLKRSKDIIKVIFSGIIGSKTNGKWKIIQTAIFSADGNITIEYKVKNILDKGKHKYAQLHTELNPHDYNDVEVTMNVATVAKKAQEGSTKGGVYNGEFKGFFKKPTMLAFNLRGTEWRVIPQNGIRYVGLSPWEWSYSLKLGTSWDTFSLTYDFSKWMKHESKYNILPVKIVVNEDNIIKKANRFILGYNGNWYGSQLVVMDKERGSLNISKEYLDIFKGYPRPLNRMSGSMAQKFKWKLAIGPFKDRKEQTPKEAWGSERKRKFGIIEWIKSALVIDKNAKFTWTLNMIQDTAKDHADLAEFLTGDGKSNPNGGINWAKKRIELGIKKPVDIAIWELGNELDWRKNREKFTTPDVYVAESKKAIAAIKSVIPDAKFAAHAATAAHDKVYHKKYGGWEAWHREVLKGIGGQIEYMVFHPYYHGTPSAKQENYISTIRADILKITGEDRIKFYISEHAKWPDHLDRSKPWKNYWHTTHALTGCLATGEWLNRMLSRKDVFAAAYHSFSSGPWGLVYYDKNKRKLYTTGIFDLFKVLNEAYGDNVVQSEVRGKYTDIESIDYTFTASVMTTKKGLNIILVNREPMTMRKIKFKFIKRYKLIKETILTANRMSSYNTVDKKEIIISFKNKENKEVFNSYQMPAKSLVVLYLESL